MPKREEAGSQEARVQEPSDEAAKLLRQEVTYYQPLPQAAASHTEGRRTPAEAGLEGGRDNKLPLTKVDGTASCPLKEDGTTSCPLQAIVGSAAASSNGGSAASPIPPSNRRRAASCSSPPLFVLAGFTFLVISHRQLPDARLFSEAEEAAPAASSSFFLVSCRLSLGGSASRSYSRYVIVSSPVSPLSGRPGELPLPPLSVGEALPPPHPHPIGAQQAEHLHWLFSPALRS